MRKPLQFSSMTFDNDDTNEQNVPRMLRILDRDGQLIELYGENDEWKSFRTFSVRGGDESLPGDLKADLVSIASVDENLLYAATGGVLLEFARQERWWDTKNGAADDNHEYAWEFLNVVRPF